MSRMKRFVLFMLAVLLVGVGLLLWTRTAGRKKPIHPAERFRRHTATAISREFPLGILTTSALPPDPNGLENGLRTLREHGIHWACLDAAGTNRVATANLLKAARKAGVRLILSAPQSDPGATERGARWLQADGYSFVTFWKGMASKPEALLLHSNLADEQTIAAYAPHAVTAANNLIPAFAVITAELAESFVRQVPASPVLGCAISLESANHSIDFGRFVDLGQHAVSAASKAGMTPVFVLPPDQHSTLRRSAAPINSWQVWASIAIGARGVLVSNADTPWPPSIPAVLTELAPFHPLLRRMEPCPDYLGKLTLVGAVYPGDLARLFHDARRKSFVAVIVTSPLRPQGTAVTLRGGALAPLQGSPPLNRLKPGQGGFYKLDLPSATASVLREARSLTPLARPMRNRMFISTYGSQFSVLCDREDTPKILHCREPVALLVEPDVHLEPLAETAPCILPPAHNYPSFRKAHINGYSLYRIRMTDRYRRLIILEEDGSTPGYNERVASMSNVGVAHNGICPSPVRKDVRSLQAKDCHMTYDLNAFRAVSCLRQDYPLYFQFDGANTRGEPDTRFHVWAGPDTEHMTERVSPRKPTPLVYLDGSDKWLKIGMPYKAEAESQPVLQRWNFFTWLRTPKPAGKD